MVRDRYRLYLAVAIGILLLLPKLASAAIPGADNPKGYTQHDLIKANLEYNHRTLGDAYRKVGNHDVQWDEHANKFLDGMALRFTNATFDNAYQLPNAPKSEDLLKEAELALSAGCDDPMVAYCYGAVLSDSGRKNQASAVLNHASKALMNSHYPLTRAAFAAARFANFTTDPKDKEAAWTKVRDCIEAILVSWDFKNVDRRILYENMRDLFGEMPRTFYKQVIDAAHEQPNADPWLTNVIEADYHITAAWDARGNGYADTVSPEGWKTFFDEVAKARDCAKAAYALHNDYPEAATMMITIAMAAGDRLNESMRPWFDKAVAAQIDYEHAYEVYINAIQPRWGGSFPKMYAFAKECLATRRYDTIVPWQYCNAVREITAADNLPDFWRLQPQSYAEELQVCDGYLKQPRKDLDNLRSYQCAIACRTGHFEDARKMLDELGNRVTPFSYEALRTLPSLAMSHSYVMGGPHAQAVNDAESKAAADDLDGAIKAYEQLAQPLKAGDQESTFIKSRLKQLEWQKQFAGGDWVNIQPDAEFSGWGAAGVGKWTVTPDAALIGSMDNSYAPQITFEGVFLGPRYEMEATVDLPPDSTASAGITSAANDPAGTWGRNGVWIKSDGTDQNFLVDDWSRDFKWRFKHQPSDVIDWKLWDGQLLVYVNGKLCLRMHDSGQLQTSKVYLGLAARCDPPDKSVRFTNIRIRELKDAPEAP